MKKKEIDYNIVIEMLDNLKGRVHVANPNGQKPEIIYVFRMFVRKLNKNELFTMIHNPVANFAQQSLDEIFCTV